MVITTEEKIAASSQAKLVTKQIHEMLSVTPLPHSKGLRIHLKNARYVLLHFTNEASFDTSWAVLKEGPNDIAFGDKTQPTSCEIHLWNSARNCFEPDSVKRIIPIPPPPGR